MSKQTKKSIMTTDIQKYLAKNAIKVKIHSSNGLWTTNNVYDVFIDIIVETKDNKTFMLNNAIMLGFLLDNSNFTPAIYRQKGIIGPMYYFNKDLVLEYRNQIWILLDDLESELVKYSIICFKNALSNNIMRM